MYLHWKDCLRWQALRIGIASAWHESLCICDLSKPFWHAVVMAVTAWQ